MHNSRTGHFAIRDVILRTLASPSGDLILWEQPFPEPTPHNSFLLANWIRTTRIWFGSCRFLTKTCQRNCSPTNGIGLAQMARLEKAPNGCWAPGEVIIPPSGGNGARQKPTPASEPDNSNQQLFLFLKRGIWNIRHFHIWQGRWFLPLGRDGNRSACLCPDDRITPNTMQCTCMVGSQQDAMAMCYPALLRWHDH